MPKPAARFSGGVTSAITRRRCEKLAAVMPEMTRPTNSHPIVGASAMKM